MQEHNFQQVASSPCRQGPDGVEPFAHMLSRYGLELTRDETTTLQVNLGLLCNQQCAHCHLDAGPGRKEVMDLQTMEEVVSFAGRCAFQVIDITGGTPELHPRLPQLIEMLAPLAPRIMLRCNLTALGSEHRHGLMQILKRYRVVIVASFPSINQAQAESQRGRGVFKRSIEMLKELNAMGYGLPGLGLELDLVSNPAGAFLPTPQEQAEKRFRKELKRRWDLNFNRLFTMANVPLGRFRRWLVASGNLEKYMQKLADSFNPCAVPGLMCRTLVSLSWEGYLYDCDFNLAKGLFMAGTKVHVSEMKGPPRPGNPIAVSDHCYTCTAGAGFT